ncbi:unnamed protein product [Leptidea sinapis]|uniref:Uncharacterized protein n=1 Tax=Leptidea sinapis TaxID=189913 RepID=A0A5E4PQN0_9NEOP|nr:unnamed protein product [Leptidea sinapis]
MQTGVWLEDRQESENKQRRRNSGRKIRRKKNKISPAKDLTSSAAWSLDGAICKMTNEETLNNTYVKPKRNDGSVGKNVNNLSTRDTEYDRVYNVIDKLERVVIRGDRYLSGDFEDMEADMYSEEGFIYDR